MERLNVDDEVEVVIKGKIIRVSDAHGLCYNLQLDRKDFNHERTIFLDEDEMVKPKDNKELINLIKRVVKANVGRPTQLINQFEKFQEECKEILKKYENE